jgi:aminoglycoside phosphotransferase family enzyme/predicted kinase
MDLAALVEAMSDPRVYPDRHDGPVEVVQTHASVVFLVGDRAWKIKKPVDLGFLDFSTLERRKADSLEELRLNRRMAPDLYHGVWPVIAEGAGLAIRRERSVAVDAKAIEWVVEMKRLPSEGMLDAVIARGEVDRAALERFARDLATFHQGAERGPLVERHGSVEVIERRVRANLTRLAEFATTARGSVAPALTKRFVALLEGATLAWLATLAPTLERRRTEGRVCDGHGDLHARNLCLVDGVIRAYDCLEFEPAYRCADVAMEVAFLAMDLDRLGHRELADSFVGAYVDASGDTGLIEPSRFFRLHYAIVRAMVEAIRLSEPETPNEERASIRDAVRSYAALAASYAVEPATILMMGLPATGKSTLAAVMASPLRATVLRSDSVRKTLFGLRPTERGGKEIYGSEASSRTYESLAAAAVDERGTVILDAAHLRADERARSIDAARERGDRWVLVELTIEESVAAERLRRRAKDPSNISDATIDVVHRLAAIREEPTEIPDDRRLRFDGDVEEIDVILACCEELLAARQATERAPPADSFQSP